MVTKWTLRIIKSDTQAREKVSQEIANIEDEENQFLIDKLSNKKMWELQNFGRKYGAKDTKKSEIIVEILQKVPIDKINKFAGE